MHRLLVVFVCLLFLSGCKIQVFLFEGGYVMVYDAVVVSSPPSMSIGNGFTSLRQGQYRIDDSGLPGITPPGDAIFEVSNFRFVKRFVAIPYDGYVFRYWGMGERSLCGGRRGVCDIDTGLARVVPGAAGLIREDTTYGLYAVFEKLVSPFPDVPTAFSCRSQQLLAPGTQYNLEYRQRNSQTNADFQHFLSTTVAPGLDIEALEGRTFNRGNVNTLHTFVTTRDNNTLETSYSMNSTVFYSDADLGKVWVFAAYNAVLGDDMNPTAAQTQIFDPAVLDDAGLMLGETNSQSVRGLYENFQNGRSLGTSEAEFFKQQTYVADQEITTGLGRLLACQIQYDVDETSSGDTDSLSKNVFLARGSGVPLLKTKDNGVDTTILEGGSINGLNLNVSLDF